MLHLEIFSLFFIPVYVKFNNKILLQNSTNVKVTIDLVSGDGGAV